MSSATWSEGHSRSHMSAQAMDEKRKENVAYEYLCHLEEARVWMGKCLEEELPPATELEPALTNGVILAKLAHFFAPQVVNRKKIYDIALEKFKATGLHFKHTDNINFWLHAMEKEGLPSIFYPTTTDIYDRKNIPKTIYCLHALGIFLHRQGKAPPVQDLVGEAEFTQEEIANMQRELDEQDIQMPAFGKIGGILADTSPPEETPVDKVNDAIKSGNLESLLKALGDPELGLASINAEDMPFILKHLKDARRQKGDALNIDEIKEAVRMAEEEAKHQRAVLAACAEVAEKALAGDLEGLMQALQNPVLGLEEINEQDISFIQKALVSALEANNGEPLDIPGIKRAAKKGALDGDHHRAVLAACAAVAETALAGNLEGLLEALQNPLLGLTNINGDDISFIQKALVAALEANNGEPLDIAGIQGAFQKGAEEGAHHRAVLAACASIAERAQTGDLIGLLNALQNPILGLGEVKEEDISFIQKALLAALEANDGEPLNVLGIQDALQKGAADGDHHRAVLAACAEVAEKALAGDLEGLYKALQNPLLGLSGIKEDDISFIQKAIVEALEANNGEPLNIRGIQGAMMKGAADGDHHGAVLAACAAVAEKARAGDLEGLLEALLNPILGLPDIYDQDISFIQKALVAALDANNGELGIPEIQAALKKGAEDGSHHRAVLAACSAVTDTALAKDLKGLLEALQNPLLGISDIKDEDVPFIQKAIVAALEANDGKPLNVADIQMAFKKGAEDGDHHRAVMAACAVVAEKALAGDLKGLMEALQNPLLGLTDIKEDDISFIQKALVAAMDVNNGILTLDEVTAAVDMAGGGASTEEGKVKVSSLQKFLHLLEANERDYEEEREIQRIKQSVVSTIRHQQELEENLNIMDIKIGLLVKNRLDLDDVVHQQTKLKKKSANALGGPSKGLKSLSKESRVKLEGYQHLFYALQTHPNYLARLIFQMPGGRTTRFIENVIFTLFNYASNQREEYLLMKLFESALKLELKTMDSVEDIAKGNATVIKMVITFNRGARGVSSLKELILPLVNRVINDNEIKINVNPVDVYKSWINQRESETGESCGMPYDVSTEKALSHPEVKERIDKTVKMLRDVTEDFVMNLCESYEKIPYGIRYFSMRLREALSKQFPGSTREDILKVVGNLLYYRFMNPAVVAPDAFDIVELSLDRGLTNEQRRNLGSIAKVLHHASANKMFDGENSALSPLNAVIEAAHQKFLTFFELSSSTADAETHYNQDKYAEVTQLAKPVVYISVREICNTHKLLLEHEEQITDGDKDIMHNLLKDLGPVPEIHDILGEAYTHPGPSATQDVIAAWEERVAEGGKSEISLTLKSTVEMTNQDEQENILTIFLQTKRMAAGLLQAQAGQNLKEIIDTKATAEQEAEFVRIQERKRAMEQRRSADEVERSGSSHEMDKSKPVELPPLQTLDEIKASLRANLDILEKEHLVDVKNNYQAILNSMAKDIRDQHRHRQQRKKELEGLNGTLAALEAKGKYYEDQREYYQMYVDACLSNLTKPKNKKKETTRKTLKYNASKLHDKGVLLEIEGLSPGQFKGVTFEIEAGETGKFNVYAKFMGVSMEKVELIFEDLLQLQYEGVAVFKMYGCAKINVNLLVFLINKKFYGT